MLGQLTPEASRAAPVPPVTTQLLPVPPVTAQLLPAPPGQQLQTRDRTERLRWAAVLLPIGHRATTPSEIPIWGEAGSGPDPLLLSRSGCGCAGADRRTPTGTYSPAPHLWLVMDPTARARSSFRGRRFGPGCFTVPVTFGYAGTGLLQGQEQPRAGTACEQRLKYLSDSCRKIAFHANPKIQMRNIYIPAGKNIYMPILTNEVLI